MQPVRIYTTDYCPYCKNAKALLDRKGVPYQEIDVTGDDEAREKLTAQTGMRTVPQIFVGEQLVGGFTDLDALEKAGKLDPLLQGG
ncbi:MAG TPA: glutaredoxin 3 [Myxococcales bacterium]|nr:glutaredoxin 3 [Myxococcales bacterium]